MTIFSCMGREQKGCVLPYEENLRRRLLIFFLVSSGCFPTLSSSAKTKSKNPYDEKRLLQQNMRIQKENNAPEDFPNFVREGLSCLFATLLKVHSSQYLSLWGTLVAGLETI